MNRRFARLAIPVVAWASLAVRADSADPLKSPTADKSQSTVTVELALLDSHSLQLTYTFPAACRQLPLQMPYSDQQRLQMRSTWIPVGSCGSEQDGKIVRAEAQCERVTFDVPVQATIEDRVYPPAFPIADLGVYVHTGIYAPTSECGKVSWQFQAAGGDVVYQGHARGETVHVPMTDADVAYMATYLSASPLAPGTKTAVSPVLPTWIRIGLNDAVSSVEDLYRRRFPTLAYSPPFVVASSVATVGPPRQQAEVAAGNLIRYAFFNPPKDASPQEVANFRGIVAHEYGHKLQPTALRKASGEADNLIHEGGAEFLRWSSMIQLGWFSGAGALNDLDMAVNTCLAIVGDQPWGKFEGRAYGEAPYACGLTVHALLLASRRHYRQSTADTVLESFYHRSENEMPDFGQALECGDSHPCSARWEPALLSNTASFATEIDRLIRSLGLAKRRFTEPPLAPQRKTAAATLMHLLDEDCDGSRGFYARTNGFEVGMSPNCKSFHDGMTISAINGISLTTEPLKAARALIAGCAARHATTIGLSAGAAIEVQCTRLTPVASHFYELDLRKILERLGYSFGADQQNHGKSH